MPLIDDIRSGNMLTVSKLIRDIDDGHPDAEGILKDIYGYSGNAQILGVTGLPGSGKSTLISLVISHYRKKGMRVAVVAVDPTSPFSGGAILGDRIRMKEHNGDPGVFIKSIATRGAFGGLSRSAADIIRVLEAAGKDMIIVETVGVGQDEVDIARLAGLALVVTAPGLGDDIQAIKAGLLEIADIFVVNKCDLAGADMAVQALKECAEDKLCGRIRPIIPTDAIRGSGMDALMEAVDGGFEKFRDKKARAEYMKKRCRYEVELKVRDRFIAALRSGFEGDRKVGEVLKRVDGKKTDPASAAKEILSLLAIT